CLVCSAAAGPRGPGHYRFHNHDRYTPGARCRARGPCLSPAPGPCMTATDRPSPSAPAGERPDRRSWYQSIAGKLLLAFGLIAALTVGATWLSLFRFNQVDAVLHRLTDNSLPQVKLALGVESIAKDVIATATDVGQAENETARAQRMDDLSDQIS